MSILQGNNIGGFTQVASTNDSVPNRGIFDNFSSSRSYAPECKCNKVNYALHLSNYEEKIANFENILM